MALYICGSCVKQTQKSHPYPYAYEKVESVERLKGIPYSKSPHLRGWDLLNQGTCFSSEESQNTNSLVFSCPFKKGKSFDRLAFGSNVTVVALQNMYHYFFFSFKMNQPHNIIEICMTGQRARVKLPGVRQV